MTNSPRGNEPGERGKRDSVPGFESGPPRRILAVKSKHLGDVICSQPAFWALHRNFPEAQLDVLVTQGMKDLVGFPWIHRVLETTRKEKSLSRLRAEFGLARQIMTGGYDLFVDFTWTDRAMWYAILSRARQRWAIQVTAGFFLKPHVYHRYGGKPDRAWHTIEHERAFLVKMGLPSYEPELFFPETPQEDLQIKAWLSRADIHPDRLVVVHPTSRWLFKCWHDDRVAALLDWLAETGWQPVLTCGPSEPELAKARTIQALTRRPVAVRLGDLTLRELAALLRQAKLFFGMDSAPMHLAAAAGTPVIALFGPSQVARWRPYGSQHHVIAAACECSGLRSPACDKSTVVKCLSQISLSEVQAVINTHFPLAAAADVP